MNITLQKRCRFEYSIRKWFAVCGLGAMVGMAEQFVLAIVALGIESEPVVAAPTAREADASCAECHPTEYRHWSESFHAAAMDPARAESVHGDFSVGEFFFFPFNELEKLPDEALRLLIERIRNTPTPESPAMEETADRFLSESVKTRLQDCFARESAFFTSLRILVYALATTTETNRRRLLEFLSPEEREWMAAEEKFLRFCGPIKLSESAAAHQRIADFMRELVHEGRVEPSGDRVSFRESAGRFFVTAEGDSGVPEEFEVAYTLGVFPLQQYLVLTGQGRIQPLPVAWNTLLGGWFPLYPGESIRPGDPLFWLGRNQNANSMCAVCHTTGFEKNYQIPTDSYQSRWDAFGVGCAACHNPCQEHATEAVAARKTLPPQPAPDDDSKNPTPRSLRPIAPNRAVPGYDYHRTPAQLRMLGQGPNLAVCAACHGRGRPVHDTPFSVDEPLADRWIPEKLDTPNYYPDGQILEENFEYGSFTQCKMFAMDVRCTNCHDPHSLGLKFEGNRLCGQCHREDSYDTEAHHHHGPNGGLGTYCVDCHMPTTEYMTFDRRYDHNIHIPRPELTLALGTPNSCNACHRDQAQEENAAWAQRWIEEWYPQESSIRGGQILPGEHYGYAIAAGREGKPDAVERLAVVVSETNERKIRPMVRAAAMELLPPIDTPQSRELLRRGLSDSSADVRRAAVGGWDSRGKDEKLESLAPLLADSARTVRIEAFRVLSTVPKSAFPPERHPEYDRARREYLQSQILTADQPATWLNLGVLEQNLKEEPLALENRKFATLQDEIRRLAPVLGNRGTAERLKTLSTEHQKKIATLTDSVATLYERGLRLDPDYFPLQINSAMLYYLRGENDRAEGAFREAIRIDPDSGDAHYSLALLLAEQNRTTEALAEFKRAAELLPNHPRAHYNYAVALFQSGEKTEAFEQIDHALRLEPANPDFAATKEFFLHNR